MDHEKGLPADWRERIKGKKVIFYNTGVSALLSENERRIQKMSFVFDEFKKHPDVVLWWRPHPLELSTAETMRPELYDMYLAARNRFLEENIGVLDESADLNRAIAVSDGYYGDWSSVVQLYEYTGKPILISSYQYLKGEEDPKDSLYVLDYCFVGEDVYMLSYNYNLVYRMDKNYEIKEIIEFDKEYSCRNFLLGRIFEHSGKLIITPGRGSHIVFYDIKSKKTHYLEYGFDGKHKKFAQIDRSEDCLYFLEEEMGQFLKIDIQNHRIDYASKQYKVRLGDPFWNNGTMYAIENMGKRIFSIDLSNNGLDVVYNGTESDCFCGYAMSIDNVFVLPQSDRCMITLLDMESGERRDLDNFPSDFEFMYDSPYSGIIEWDGCAYLFPGYSNRILRVDIKGGKIEPFGEKYIRDNYDIVTGGYVKKKNDLTWVFLPWKNEWNIVDFKTGSITRMDIKMQTIMRNRVVERLIFDRSKNCDEICSYQELEGKCATLRRFIKSILLFDDVWKSEAVGSVGSAIHTAIKSS